MRNLKKRIETIMSKALPFGEYKWLVVLGGSFVTEDLLMRVREDQEWLMEAFEDNMVAVIDNVKDSVEDVIIDHTLSE